MNLQPIEQNNQRVLTTNQLAESFGTDTKIIHRNFQRNADRYKHGKHYFSLTGEELRSFKGSRQIDDNLKFTSVLYLWTEKGAWLHAKSLNTDEAWDAYEMLVDDYYIVKESIQPNNTKLLLKTALEHEEKIESIQSDVDYLKNNMRIDGAQEHAIKKRANQVVIESLNGKGSPAYKVMAFKVFSQFWRDFKNHFEIPRYGDLPKKKYEEGLRFIGIWQPPTTLKIEIDNTNQQQVIKEVI